MRDCQFIIRVLDTFQSGDYPDIDGAELLCLSDALIQMRYRYVELRHTVSFAEASLRARSEWLEGYLNETD